jgi:hypothetical protein
VDATQMSQMGQTEADRHRRTTSVAALLTLPRATGRLNHAQIRENTMTMSSLSARIRNQRPFAMHIDHRRARGRQVPRGLGVLLGLL